MGKRNLGTDGLSKLVNLIKSTLSSGLSSIRNDVNTATSDIAALKEKTKNITGSPYLGDDRGTTIIQTTNNGTQMANITIDTATQLMSNNPSVTDINLTLSSGHTEGPPTSLYTRVYDMSIASDGRYISIRDNDGTPKYFPIKGFNVTATVNNNIAFSEEKAIYNIIIRSWSPGFMANLYSGATIKFADNYIGIVLGATSESITAMICLSKPASLAGGDQLTLIL